MLTDSHPAYPMSCFVFLHVAGSLDETAFRQAITQTLKLHPLLHSTVEKTGKVLRWVECETEPVIQFVDDELALNSAAPSGIDLFVEPGLKTAVLPSDTPGRRTIRFEVHHSAADAGGMLRFIEDVFAAYAEIKKNGTTAFTRPAVEPELLSRRGRFGWTFWNFLRLLPQQIWGLDRARTFLFHRIIPLVPQKPDLSRQMPPPAFPALLSHEWDVDQTRQIRDRAKQAGLTLNDVALAGTFQVLNAWREQQKIPCQRGYLRLAVPTNLRTAADRLMPAANIVSMVFLDRKPAEISDTEEFSQRIHREMEHIKRCNLGWALIHGLAVYRRLFGSYKKMIDQNRCWTTATVSNLGVCFAEAPFLKRDRRIFLDDELELLRLDSAPPIRPQSALGICLLCYAGRLTVNMQYDTTVLRADQAETIFQKWCDVFKE